MTDAHTQHTPVTHLESNSEITAIPVRNVLDPRRLLALTAAEDDSRAGRLGHERRRLEIRLAHVLLETGRCGLLGRVGGRAELEDLALDKVGNDGGQELDDLAAAEAGKRHRCAAEEEVAGEDAELVAESGRRRLLATAQVSAVNHVVVEKGRDVDHLGDARQPPLSREDGRRQRRVGARRSCRQQRRRGRRRDGRWWRGRLAGGGYPEGRCEGGRAERLGSHTLRIPVVEHPTLASECVIDSARPAANLLLSLSGCCCPSVAAESVRRLTHKQHKQGTKVLALGVEVVLGHGVECRVARAKHVEQAALERADLALDGREGVESVVGRRLGLAW